MIEDFYKLSEEDEDSLEREYPKCKYCGEKLRLRARKPKLVRMLFFWLPLKKYKCTNCRQSTYTLK